MKSSIHPEYFETTVHCAGCDTKFVTGSTVPSARVDICSNCHPFYTGQKKLVDTEGRVERFERRMSQRAEQRKPKKAAPSLPSSATKAAATKPATSTQEQSRPKTLREMLQEAANNSR